MWEKRMVVKSEAMWTIVDEKKEKKSFKAHTTIHSVIQIIQFSGLKRHNDAKFCSILQTKSLTS